MIGTHEKRLCLRRRTLHGAPCEVTLTNQKAAGDLAEYLWPKLVMEETKLPELPEALSHYKTADFGTPLKTS